MNNLRNNDNSKVFFDLSVIIPVRNEEKNVPIIFKKLPRLKEKTEAIFVEGGSSDNTWNIAKKFNNKINPNGVYFRLLKQIGKGKGNAVRTGFNNAKGKVLIIYDGDITIKMKALKKFIEPIDAFGENILVTGDRMSLKQESGAMKFINYVGNHFFALYYSFLLKDKIRDCCCGTKALSKKLWFKIEKIRKIESDLDPWGDIDLLYYGRRTGARIISIPVEYLVRRHGETKMQRWSLAWRMFKIGVIILKNNFDPNKTLF